MNIPEATLRLFDGYEPAQLAEPRHRPFLVERLFEEGDSQDLRWLSQHVQEEELRRIFQEATGLTARTRRFWSLVLEGRIDTDPAGQEDLWPL